jgi:type II secretory pathway pseudopilin PulG
LSRAVVFRLLRLHAMRTIQSARGFSLLEVLIAATTLLVALSALAQLLIAAALAARRARALTLAAVFAQQKLEALLPQAAIDGTLRASPPGVLAENADGYCDFVDAAGAVVGTGVDPPPAAAFVRRWSIEPSAAGVPTIALRVLVIDAQRAGVDARVATIVRAVP